MAKRNTDTRLSRHGPLSHDIFFPGQVGSVFRDIENELARLWGSESGLHSSMSSTLGQMDIKETKDAFQFKMDAPGLTKANINIRITPENVLLISGERSKEEEKKDESGFLRCERSYGKFTRSFQLPEKSVDVKKIRANMEHGELQLSIPKKEPEPQAEDHEIKIE